MYLVVCSQVLVNLTDVIFNDFAHFLSFGFLGCYDRVFYVKN